MARAAAVRHVDEGSARSQRLVEAALRGDVEVVDASLRGDGDDDGEVGVDVNYIGAVTLRVKCTETVLREEMPDEVRIGYEEFRTDVSALFAAAHSGHVDVVRRLLVKIPFFLFLLILNWLNAFRILNLNIFFYLYVQFSLTNLSVAL